MARSFRKQTHADYLTRVTRVNRAFHKKHRDRSNDRPVRYGLIGFLWFYVVLTIATRKTDIIASLQSGSLPDDMHNLVLSVMAVAIGVSCVLLLFHVARFAVRRQERRNSGGLVFGAVAALALIITPPSVFEAGLGLLDDNTRMLVTSTQSIDWSEVVLVSSQMVKDEFTKAEIVPTD